MADEIMDREAALQMAPSRSRAAPRAAPSLSSVLHRSLQLGNHNDDQPLGPFAACDDAAQAKNTAHVRPIRIALYHVAAGEAERARAKPLRYATLANAQRRFGCRNVITVHGFMVQL